MNYKVTILVIVMSIVLFVPLFACTLQGGVAYLLKPERPADGPRRHEFPSRVISEELIASAISYPYVTELNQAVFETQKPELEQLIENSREWFDFLIRTFGAVGRREVDAVIEEWKKQLKSQPDPFVSKGYVVKIDSLDANSSSIQFENALFDSPSGNPKDPVNLVFWKKGSAWDVQFDMKNWIAHRWRDAFGSDLYAHLDRDHADDLDWIWKAQDYQLEYDSFFIARYHIRLFYGRDDWDSFRHWSIAGVHHEFFALITHIVDDWEGSEKFVKDDFSGQPFVGSIVYVYLYNAGQWQGVPNDGWAPFIELLY